MENVNEKVAELKHQLTLPVCKNGSDEWFEAINDVFNPWEVFDCFYGSYSSEFDDMAIEVMEGIQRGEYVHEPLSHQMFREVLCKYNLCDYGTSPRGCFPNWGSGFAELLPELIDKWKQYREAQWGDE